VAGSVFGHGVSGCAASPDERAAVAIPVKNEEKRLPVASAHWLTKSINLEGLSCRNLSALLPSSTTATTTAPISLDHWPDACL
jgi:hypothetical protein